MTVCSNHALLFFCDLQTCEQAVKGSRTRKRELNACLTTCSPLQPAALLFTQLTNALRETTAERLHVIGIVDFLAAAFKTIAILCPSLQPGLHRSCLAQVHPHPRDCGLMQKHFLNGQGQALLAPRPPKGSAPTPSGAPLIGANPANGPVEMSS